MKKFISKVSAATVLSTMPACAGKDSGPDPLPPYVGTWEAACTESSKSVKDKLQLSAAYEIRTYAFNTTTYSFQWQVFTDQSCADESLALEIDYGEGFTAGDVVDQASSAKSIDLKVGDIAAFMLTSDLIAYANSTNLCEGGWVKSAIDRSETYKKDLTSLQCIDGDTTAVQGQTIYSAYKIENGAIRFAVGSTDRDGTSESRRMTELGETRFEKK